MQNLLKLAASNWKSGLTVALVSLPLSLSLAIASGATPIMGIITAVWAGLVAAVFGGSDYNVIGPAGALAAIIAAFGMVFGPALMPALAICSGLLMLAIWLLRLDRYLVFIPSSVMYGFTLGVGLAIGLGQLNSVLGLSGLPAHESLLLNLLESLRHLGQTQLPTLGLFAACLALLFAGVRFFPKVPGAVVVAVIGIAVGWAAESHLLPFEVQTLLAKYGTFHADLFQPPALLPPLDPVFFKAVVTVAVVAVLETLLSAKIADGMTGSRFHQSNEVRGVALANIASGIAGGLPATGVFVRTALNVKTGATSRVSSGLNACFVAIISLLLFSGFQYLPLAAVASILVFAAIRMVDVKEFKKLYRFDRGSFWLALVVAVLVFSVDSMIGLLFGVAASLLIFVTRLSRAQSELTLHKPNCDLLRIPHHKLAEHEGDCDIVVYRFAGELTYFNGNSHEDNIRRIKAKTIILSLRNLLYADLDGVEILHGILTQAEKAGHVVYLTSISEFVRPTLEKAVWFKRMQEAGGVFASTTDALTALGFPKR
jgi:SulP family sulfate permease